MKDQASKGATVQTGLSEVSTITSPVPEQDTQGKDQKPVATPKTAVKGGDRPGKFRFC